MRTADFEPGVNDPQKPDGARRFVPAALVVLGVILGAYFLTRAAQEQTRGLTSDLQATTLAMALISLGAAVVAFWGPRLGVDRLAALRRPGLLGAFGYGFIFSLGTSAAPLLLLLTLAATQAKPGYGFILALAFGLGRGLPFLLVGLFTGAVMRLTRIVSWRRVIEVVSGCALLFVSIYYARAFAALL
ncbi:MAG: thiol:disulfide interchange protein [Acidobacteria bacterium]|nr:thiol:disulfide interchange protein [Acidobacteriota bacterium]